MPDENVTSQTGARKPRPYGEFRRCGIHHRHPPAGIALFPSFINAASERSN
jgi:hypothetical protein